MHQPQSKPLDAGPEQANMHGRYAIVDPSYTMNPDEAPILSVSLDQDTVAGFWYWRDSLWPEAHIVDLQTWQVVSYGRSDA